MPTKRRNASVKFAVTSSTTQNSTRGYCYFRGKASGHSRGRRADRRALRRPLAGLPIRARSPTRLPAAGRRVSQRGSAERRRSRRVARRRSRSRRSRRRAANAARYRHTPSTARLRPLPADGDRVRTLPAPDRPERGCRSRRSDGHIRARDSAGDVANRPATRTARERCNPSEDLAVTELLAEPQGETLTFPAILPVLPLKEMVVFPDSMTPLAIGQERSIKLVEDAV